MPCARHRAAQERTSDFTIGCTILCGEDAWISKPVEPTDPYVSSLQQTFPTADPVRITLGGEKVLYDSTMAYAFRMRGGKAGRLILYEAPHAPLFVGHVRGEAKESDAEKQTGAGF